MMYFHWQHRNVSSLFTRIILICGFLLVGSQNVSAETTVVQAALIMEGMKASREMLRSGVYRASGRYYKDREARQALVGNVEVFSAFDFGKEQFRFDRQQPVDWVEGATNVDSSPLAKFVRTDKQTLHFDSTQTVVVVGPPDDKQRSLVMAFDIRSVGMTSIGALNLGWTLDRVIEDFATVPPAEVSEEGGLSVLVWMVGEPAHMRTSMWVDVNRGYTPVKYEVRLRGAEPARGQLHDEWNVVNAVSETSWNEQGSTWVPSSLAAETQFAPGKKERYELVFDWESVNEPVAMDLFTTASLEAPSHFSVVDTKLGRRIPLGTVEDVAGPPRTPPIAQAASAYNWTMALAACGAVLIFAGTTLWLMRRSKPPRTPR